MAKPPSPLIKITPLGFYASKKIVKRDADLGITWCLVGDAAYGLPFFRGLNNGFLTGTDLSKRIVRELNDTTSRKDRLLTFIARVFGSSLQGPFFTYSFYATILSKKEIVIARCKSLFLDMVLVFVKISAHVPWQVNYWPEKKLRALRTV